MKCQFQRASLFKDAPRITIALSMLILVVLPFRVVGEDGDDSLVGKPVVARNSDGHLEIFKVDADGELRHRWQKFSNGDWSAWASLGGSLLPGIGVATNAEGALQIFAVSRKDQSLCMLRQAPPSSMDWLEWTNLGGAVQPPLAVGQGLDGHIEVFAVAANGSTVRHLWQPHSDVSWSPWADLGGHLAPSLAVACNRDGHLELFGVDAENGALVHDWQLHPGDVGGWSGWKSLGGSILPGFAIGQNILGRLEVFAVNRTNSAIERVCQASPGLSAQWTLWSDFGSKLKLATEASPITNLDNLLEEPVTTRVKSGLAVGQSADGRIEVMAVAKQDSMLLHRWETLCDGSDHWSAWASLGKPARPFPAVVQNEDGDLEVFAVDVKNSAVLNHRRQISHASDWLDWSSLDRPTFQYSSRAWQTDEGLPDNLVQAITQTRDGYLWAGTREGLARFDGVSFLSFNSKNTPEIQDSSITALCADHSGALWIGTDGGGLVCLNQGKFSHYGKTNGLAGDTIRAIYEGKDGSLWVGTSTGLSRLKNGGFTNYFKKDGLLSDVIRYVYEDRDGNVWIATGAGLNRLHGQFMDSFAMPNGLPNDSVRALCQDQGGRIWIGSNNGMLWYNWFWMKDFYAYNTRFGLSDTFVSAICEDQEGNLWVGTYSGLNRFREGRFFVERDNDGLPFGKVNTLFADREGDLWVGSNEGLIRLTPKRFTTYTKAQGLTHNNVMSVLEDHSGNMWVGTWGGGLDRLQDERVTSYATTNGFSQNLLLALCEGRDGSLWLGADYDGGLTRLKDGQFTHYTWKDGLLDAAIRVIHEDNSGKLWLGTSQGLCCFESGKFTVFTGKENLSGDAVRAICGQQPTNLWFGADSGLYRWDGVHFARYSTAEGLSDNTVRALYEDKEKNLWIGTGNGGLNRFHDGRFTSCTKQQGLFSNEIFDIVEDNFGWLWMSCSQGVFRVNKQDLKSLESGELEKLVSIAYGKTDGMESPQCSGSAKPGVWKSRDGRLWFATGKGLSVVDPATLKINAVPPPVYIQEFVADKKPIVIPNSKDRDLNDSASESVLARWSLASHPGALSVPPGHGELEFHYTALSFAAPENTRFKYKLEGIDPDWVDAGTRRVAYYNSVYPGSYCFRVIARNKEGVWNEVGASLPIVLAPHVWQIWWLRAGVGLFLLAATSGTALYVTKRRMQRKLELVERRHAIERERGRIAKDIHDDLGSSLTRIMMLGERAADGLDKREDVGLHVQKIVSSARHTVQALDEIVWAVNPENDTLEGLVEYISHYADEFFEDGTVSCRLEMPAKLPDVTLSAEIRHDLFLVIKEAFNNILKHSQASQVVVRVSASATHLDIGIEDNGRGFVPGQSDNGRKGNGLENMRKRIESHGGRFDFESAPNKGTKVRMTARLTARSLN